MTQGWSYCQKNNQPTEPILCEQQAAIKYCTIELVQRPSLGCAISVPTDHFFKHNSSYMSITQLRESSGSDTKGHRTTQVFTLHKTHQNIQFGLLKATAPQDDWNLQKPSFFNSKQPSIATQSKSQNNFQAMNYLLAVTSCNWSILNFKSLEPSPS
jgi:hypothetical protein